jgi:hypothetical protein
MSTVEYPNVLSRLLLAGSVERQFAFPLWPRPQFETRLLQWYERNVLRVDTSGIVIDRPIFLVGLPRSGTTMLQDILCAHPAVGFLTNLMNAYPDSFCAMHVICKRLRLDFRADRFLGDSIEIELGSPNEGLTALRGLEQDFYSLEHRALKLEDFSPQIVEGWREGIRRVLWCFGGRARRFFNKNPEFLTQMRFIRQLFPDAKFVYIVRDPRECANSMVKLCRLIQTQEARLRGLGEGAGGLFVPYPRLPKLAEYVATYGADDIRTTARLWNDSVAFVEDSAPECVFHRVRYEDILADPAGEIAGILRFCELDPVDPSVTQFWDKIRNVGVLRHSNQYGSFELIEKICAGTMERYGYAPRERRSTASV